jgi:citrate synthase
MSDVSKPAGTATLTYEGKTVEMPVLAGSTGPNVIDIRKLYGATDAFTFDPGFTSTAACESALTFIDGDAGTLLHRGYPIGVEVDLPGGLPPAAARRAADGVGI